MEDCIKELINFIKVTFTAIGAFLGYILGESDSFLYAFIEKQLSSGIGFRDRGVKEADFYVLRETKTLAILVEIGFIDNTKDSLLFNSKSA